jgi:hypothetical protein
VTEWDVIWRFFDKAIVEVVRVFHRGNPTEETEEAGVVACLLGDHFWIW